MGTPIASFYDQLNLCAGGAVLAGTKKALGRACPIGKPAPRRHGSSGVP
jgi:hypothetical protein